MKPAEIDTTCQICGRPVRLLHGAIAQHGYKQPWLRFGSHDGTRTPCCDGSGHQPYETHADAILPAIDRRIAFRDHLTAERQELIDNPPAVLQHQRRYAGRPHGKPVELARPERFDSSNRPASFRPDSFEWVFWQRVNGLAQQVRETQESIDFLTARLAAWGAAHPPGLEREIA
jgi:hypothetical protein